MQQPLIETAKIIRKEILEMVCRAKASHIGSCYSVVDILNILYGQVLDMQPGKVDARDHFILSKGHAAAALYATLATYGYFPKEELTTYCENGARLAGHVTALAPGVEFSTGSLGHGLPIGCGVALASAKKVYVVQSDGECDEGSTWEAALFAAHHKLSNVTLVIDYNKIQSFGSIDEVLKLDSLADKWRAFNWHVIEANGHDYTELQQAFDENSNGLPKVIIAHTIKGKGVSYMENDLLWHYKSPDKQQYQTALEELTS